MNNCQFVFVSTFCWPNLENSSVERILCNKIPMHPDLVPTYVKFGGMSPEGALRENESRKRCTEHNFLTSMYDVYGKVSYYVVPNHH